MADTKLEPIACNNLEQLMAIAEEHGMPRSLRWYERFLFSDFQKNEAVGCRGYLVKSDADGVVGCLCLAPIEGWVKQTKKTFCRIANFACRKKYGVHALEMIAEIVERAGGNLMFTNSLANTTALACWKFARFKEGPELCCHQYFLNIGLMGKALASRFVFRHPIRTKAAYSILRPIDFMGRMFRRLVARNGCRVVEDFSSPAWGKFWNEFLAKNDGVITSRDPKILSDLFNESLHAGTMTLLASYSGDDITGYILLRKAAKCPYTDYCYYRVADWCALGNDMVVLKQLFDSAVEYCVTHNALCLEYIGGNSETNQIVKTANPVERKLDHQTFVYHVDDEEIRHAFDENKGWFFGPYDGDHCLGYGGYVDL